MTANVRNLRTAAEDSLIDMLSDADVGAARDRALAQLKLDGLPHRRVEAWKYFDLRAMMRDAKPRAERTRSMALPAPFGDLDVLALTFVDAHLVSMPTTLPKGLVLRRLSEGAADLGRLVDAQQELVADVAAALAVDGLIIEVMPGAEIKTPLLVDFQASGADVASSPRLFIKLGEGASMHLLETHRGASGSYQVNGVAEIILGANARLDHVKLQAQSREALHVSTAIVELHERAHYHAFSLEEGSAQCRRQFFVRYAGEHANLTLLGAMLATARQHLDTTLIVDHASPHGTSREMFKMVLADQSRGVFQGKIVVRPKAQKTDGQMRANVLLLNEGPEFNAKPELEIFADDVVCAHGATAGALDEDLMFYLRARGIPEREAKSLLATAFVGEAVEGVENEAVRAILSERIQRWLEVNLA
jgi:Fe-S cluster assembly protein SufD